MCACWLRAGPWVLSVKNSPSKAVLAAQICVQPAICMHVESRVSFALFMLCSTASLWISSALQLVATFHFYEWCMFSIMWWYLWHSRDISWYYQICLSWGWCSWFISDVTTTLRQKASLNVRLFPAIPCRTYLTIKAITAFNSEQAWP